jgi:ribonuclease HII
MSLKPYYMKDMLEVGIDEAGRGSLFGRLYVGAAILPQDESFQHHLMRDSKKLSARKRLIAYDYIRENAIDYSIVHIDERKIDDINVFWATQKGMRDVLLGLRVVPQHILVDGNYFETYIQDGKLIPFTCIEGGDDKYTPIAAASILAKVARDKYIEKMCDTYDNLEIFYNLRQNKGYGTSEHIQGIEKNGITEWHRKTFGICKSYS